VDASFAPVAKPVYLHYRRLRYYGRLHQAIGDRIETAVRDRLARRPRPRRGKSS
jgi:hypothetical protein